MTRVGTWSMLPSQEVVEALARSGADFVGLDAQHGAHGFRDLVEAIRLLDGLGVESLVRVFELKAIPRYLDFGATGVIVPMIDSAEEARQAVGLARYQPHGTRSYGGRRYGLSREPDILRDAQPLVYAMVETAGALDAVDGIASVPGLAGVFVGPVDLALAIGGDGPLVRRLSEASAGIGETLGDADASFAARWNEALARVLTATHRAEIEAGMFALGGGDAAHWVAAGFDRVVVGSDIALLRGALTRELSAARK